MSSSTWRVLSGYATYQRTPMRMTSGGKWAPLKLIDIVTLPPQSLWVIGEIILQIASNENLRQNPMARFATWHVDGAWLASGSAKSAIPSPPGLRQSRAA